MYTQLVLLLFADTETSITSIIGISHGHLSYFPLWKAIQEKEGRLNHSVFKTKWAPSSEFGSSSIPSWQILTAHAQPFRGARDLAFCLKVPLDSILVWASSGGSGETARMRRLARTFAARICDKDQIRLTRPKNQTAKMYLAFHQWDIGKQCRPRSNAAELRVWSRSTLFAYRNGIKTSKYTRHP